MSDPVLTQKEWHAVEQYNHETAKQIEAQQNQPKPETEPSLYEILEASGIENLRESISEIAFFQGMKERSADNQISQWCDYFIRIYRSLVEDDYENIKRWRNEFKELQRRR